MSMRHGLQERGQDGSVVSLRSLIPKCEADGMVDLGLGGHTYKRPPAVMQGMESDQPLGLTLFQWQAEVRGGREGVNRDGLASQPAADQRASGYQGFGGCAFFGLGSGLSPFQFMTSR